MFHTRTSQVRVRKLVPLLLLEIFAAAFAQSNSAAVQGFTAEYADRFYTLGVTMQCVVS